MTYLNVDKRVLSVLARYPGSTINEILKVLDHKDWASVDSASVINSIRKLSGFGLIRISSLQRTEGQRGRGTSAWEVDIKVLQELMDAVRLPLTAIPREQMRLNGGSLTGREEWAPQEISPGEPYDYGVAAGPFVDDL